MFSKSSLLKATLLAVVVFCLSGAVSGQAAPSQPLPDTQLALSIDVPNQAVEPVTISATFCNGVSEIPLAECQALVALYNGTNGDAWTTKTGWGTTTTPCSWFGITCSGGHVTQINLPSNNLAGNFPSEIGNLTSLTNLRVQNNKLLGDLPSTFINLVNLAQNQNDFGNNGIGTLNTTLDSFLGNKDSDWKTTQLLPPGNFQAVGGNNQLNVSWTRTGDVLNTTRGYYLYIATSPIGPFHLLQSYDSRLNSSYLSNAINGGKTYYTKMVSYVGTTLGEFTPTVTVNVGGQASPSTISSTFCNGVTQIPALECQALVALYNSTQGNQWLQTGGWGVTNTPCSWYGITCESGTNITSIVLYRNWLKGSIPSQIGNLTQLKFLNVTSNSLSGNIPTEITNLSNLVIPSIEYNALTSPSAAVTTFLTNKNPSWATKQTTPPTNIQASNVTTNSATLTWTPIVYTAYNGNYEVSYSTSASGIYTVAGTTVDKTTATFTVTGLNSNTTYFFRIRTFTDSNEFNQNPLYSVGLSLEGKSERNAMLEV